MKKITVIIPVYNAESYLLDCLDSVLHQSYEHWECICLNDGSNDDSLALLQLYAARDSRFKVYSQENKGMSAAYNALLDYVEETDYLFILDSDDYIHPSTFSICAKLMEEHSVDLVDFSIEHVPTHSRLSELDCKLPCFEPMIECDMSIYLSRRAVKPDWNNKCNKLYRWDKIQNIRFDEQLTYEDDFWYSSLTHSIISSKIVLPLPLYFYRKNNDGVTGKLNLEMYTKNAIRRIDLSIEYFLKGGRITPRYYDDFMWDLENDAYRMILQKNMKKNKNAAQRQELFLLAAGAMNRLIEEKGITFSRLPFMKRWALSACCAKRYRLCRFFVKLASI